MQNKAALWIFTGLLALACLYELSFTAVTSGVEKEAKVVAQEKARFFTFRKFWIDYS